MHSTEASNFEPGLWADHQPFMALLAGQASLSLSHSLTTAASSTSPSSPSHSNFRSFPVYY